MIGSAFTGPEKWILKGIPILFIIGTVLHFTYDLLWKNPLVGLVSPLTKAYGNTAKWWYGLSFCGGRFITSAPARHKTSRPTRGLPALWHP